MSRIQLTHDTMSVVCSYVAANSLNTILELGAASSAWLAASRDPLVWGPLVEVDLPHVKGPQVQPPDQLYRDQVKKPSQFYVDSMRPALLPAARFGVLPRCLVERVYSSDSAPEALALKQVRQVLSVWPPASRKPPVERTSRLGQKSLLHMAAQCTHPRVCRLLLDAGADIHAQTRWGITPLHYAADPGGGENVTEALVRETMTLLLARGARVDSRDTEGYTPLHDSLMESGVGEMCARLLISHGSDVNAANEEGWRPLHVAVAYYASPPMISLLLEHGAEVDAKTSQQNTALRFAVNDQQLEAAALLRAYGATE